MTAYEAGGKGKREKEEEKRRPPGTETEGESQT